MSEDSGDKQFEATPEKLKQARKRGEIVRSQDLFAFAMYLGFYLCLLFVSDGMITDVARVLSHIPAQAGTMTGMGEAPQVVLRALARIAVLFIVPIVLVLLMVAAQRAFVVTPKNIQPKLSNISPLSNFKKKFGRSGLFGFAKSLVKLVVISVLVALYLLRKRDVLAAAITSPPAQIMLELGALLVELYLIVSIIMLVMGGVDYLWQHAEHARKNRMSHKEMRDEVKNSEGDPEVKAQRRQRGQQIALNQMLADVPQADVVIVNPTHYAVALAWDRAGGGAPSCVAKGVDEIAASIRRVAQESAVPIHSDPPTARALHATTEIGDQISPDHYMAVAAAIRFADDMRRKARER